MWKKVKSWFSWETKENKVEPPSPIPDKKQNPPDLSQANSPAPSKNSDKTISEKIQGKILEPIQKIADMDSKASFKSIVKSGISSGARKILFECQKMSIEAFEEKYGKLTVEQKKMVSMGTSHGIKIVSDAIADAAAEKFIEQLVVHYGPEIFQSAAFETLGVANQYVQAFMVGYSVGNKINYVAEVTTGRTVSDRLATSMAEFYMACTDANCAAMLAPKMSPEQEKILTTTPVVGLFAFR